MPRPFVKAHKYGAKPTNGYAEEWRPVVGYPGYQVSSAGRVFSGKRCGRVMLQQVVRGYLKAKLRNASGPRMVSVHSLVLEAFVGPRPDNMHGCHCNGDRLDNRLENLRWDTPSGNCADKVAHGTWQGCGNHPRTRLTDWDVAQIRAQRGFLSGLHLADMFETSSSHVSEIQLRQSWVAP